MRTALCILGVALATTFVVAVGATTMRYTAVIKEMNVLFSGQVMVVSEDTIVIQAVPITRGFLPDRLIENISGIDKVDEAVPILFITSITLEGIINPVPPNFTFGIPLENWQMLLGQASLERGRFPSSELSSEIVVGSSLADQYNYTVGSRIEINGYELNVTGILDTKLAILARSIIMPLKLAQAIYYPRINIVVAKPVQGCSQKNLANEIEAQVGEAYNVKALTEDERNDMIQPILAQVEMWNAGIQTIVFIMSMILVMTVTLMSVSERRRDFATLAAIGAPLNYVFRVVIFEAMLIGVLGGILGIALGSFSAISLASFYTDIPLRQFFPSILEIVPPLYMLEIFAAIVLVCCLGGIFPAINATRMRIAEVLRAEY